jgi:hypothetical protein
VKPLISALKGATFMFSYYSCSNYSHRLVLNEIVSLWKNWSFKSVKQVLLIFKNDSLYQL